MAYQPLENLLPRAGGSIYKLVLMAARRAKELADGAPNLVESPASAKTATIALDEINAGKVETKEVFDERAAATKPRSKKKE